MTLRKVFMPQFKSIILVASLVVSATSPFAHAMGGRRPDEPTGPVTPAPVRNVVLDRVNSQVFQLPNGSQVNLSADLDSMLITAVTSTPTLAPYLPENLGLCDTTIRLKSAVTTFQMNVGSVSTTFGYTPSGSSSPITSLTGTAKVNIGAVAMDFSLWECGVKGCRSVAATTATHLTAGVEASFGIDFSSITTGPSFVYNTNLGKILRKIMNEGLGRLASSPRLVELGWRARVVDYEPGTGIVTFDQGVQSRLGTQQTFSIYAAEDATFDGCDVSHVVAHATTTQVDTLSSIALVDQTFGSRGVKVGDWVMVRVSATP